MSMDLTGLPPELLAQLSKNALNGIEPTVSPRKLITDDLAEDAKKAILRLRDAFTSNRVIDTYIYQHELRAIAAYILHLEKRKP